MAEPASFLRDAIAGVGARAVVRAREHFCKTPGNSGVTLRAMDALNLLREGPRHEVPMLLIHGTAASVAWWNPVLPALADHHGVMRIDLPGHGQSPPASSYRVTAQAARVAELLGDLAVRPVIVIGHSSGGYIATALAEQRRDLVRAMALISVGPALSAFRSQPAFARALAKPPVGRIVWMLRSAWIRRALGTAFSRPVEIPDELVTAVRDMDYNAFVSASRESSDYLAQRAVPDRLASLDIPVIVIFGAEDRRWDSSAAHSYDSVPNTQIEILPGIGHTPMFEAPEITSELLLAFAARLDGKPSSTSLPEG